MADQPGKGGGFLKEEFAGIPGWIWLVGAVVMVGGYLYLRRQSSSSQGGQQQSSQQGRPSAEVFLIPFQTITKTWHQQHHKSPSPKKMQNTQTGA